MPSTQHPGSLGAEQRKPRWAGGPRHPARRLSVALRCLGRGAVFWVSASAPLSWPGFRMRGLDSVNTSLPEGTMSSSFRGGCVKTGWPTRLPFLIPGSDAPLVVRHVVLAGRGAPRGAHPTPGEGLPDSLDPASGVGGPASTSR